MRAFALLMLAVTLVVPVQSAASEPPDAVSWLGRIATAGQRLNYSGTFIYQSGRNFETSRITRKVDSSGEHERLEVLDGSPREVIRSNREVRCVLPDQKTIIIDRSGGQRAFPARLPTSYAVVAESYRISVGDVSRVAGLDAQLVLLEPRDDLRYGHLLWAERDTGLLLKARMVDENGEIIEQFTFTDVSIGGEIDMEALKPRYVKNDSWRVIDAQGDEVRPGDSEWALSSPLPGYALKSVVRRPLGRDLGDILHLVYSDGLASISVFIEPLEADGVSASPEAFASGPINIYKRTVGGYLVTALGEVPLRAVRRLGDGIEPATR